MNQYLELKRIIILITTQQTENLVPSSHLHPAVVGKRENKFSFSLFSFKVSRVGTGIQETLPRMQF